MLHLNIYSLADKCAENFHLLNYKECINLKQKEKLVSWTKILKYTYNAAEL